MECFLTESSYLDIYSFLRPCFMSFTHDILQVSIIFPLYLLYAKT